MGKVNKISQVDGESNMVPACACRWKISKGTMAFASMSVWEQATSLILTPKPHNSVLPCMSLVLFELLLQHRSSKQVSLSASKCVHIPFKRKAWDWDSSSSLSQLQSLLVFTTRGSKDLFSRH